MERYRQFGLSKKKIIINSFLGGIAWGIGTIVGIILLGIIAVPFLRHLNFIPIIGNFAVSLAEYIAQHTRGGK